MRRSRNPYIGAPQPTLFGEERPMHTPIEELPEERLMRLPREAFSQEEWDSLDEEIQEHIHEHDPASRGRIEKMVAEFVKRHKWLEEPDEQYVRDSFEDDFDWQMREYADELIERAHRYARNEHDHIFDTFSIEGYTEDQIRAAFLEALQDNNNYETTYLTNEYDRAFFKAVTSESFYIDEDDLENILEGMFPDEIEAALEEINRVTDLSLDADDLRKRHGIEIDDYARHYADMDPNWERVHEAVAESLRGEEPEAVPEVPELPAEERIVHRWPDGFYVLDLLPQELLAENRDARGKKRGLCVGDPRYGYAEAVKEGVTKILSLRRPDGEKVFTLEVRLKSTGNIDYVRQIKGAHNALPTSDDVPKLRELLEKIGLPWRKIKDIKDMKPALKEIGLIGTGEKENPDDCKDYHCGFCRPHWED